jgi:hypothetical protein
MIPARMMTAPHNVRSHPMIERPLKKRTAMPAMSGISESPKEL